MFNGTKLVEHYCILLVPNAFMAFSIICIEKKKEKVEYEHFCVKEYKNSLSIESPGFDRINESWYYINLSRSV